MIIIQCLRYCHTLLVYNDKEMFWHYSAVIMLSRRTLYEIIKIGSNTFLLYLAMFTTSLTKSKRNQYTVHCYILFRRYSLNKAGR